MAEKSNTVSGVSFMGLLAILFIGLKLCGIISWSWWLVLLPLYGLITLVLFLVLLAIVIEHLMK